MDTPISETGFIGAAIGAAVSGMRPIAELMFVDFFGVCMDQIYNHMAKIHYMSGGNLDLPVVLTTAIGGGYSDAAQHSQMPLRHLRPPARHEGRGARPTPYDAKGLMIAAIRDDNPVLYFFHKGIMGLRLDDPRTRARPGRCPRSPTPSRSARRDVKREGTRRHDRDDLARWCTRRARRRRRRWRPTGSAPR